MRHVLKLMLVGMVLASAIGVGTDAVEASAEPAATVIASGRMPTPSVAIASLFSAPRGEPWCWFCERYEGQEEHPETMQMVDVVYAYCGDYPMGGGATICDEPVNDWYWEGGDEWIWIGDTCQLQDYGATSPYGDEECDCTWVSTLGWPYDATTLDNCFPPTPAAGLAADGFVSGVQAMRAREGESLGHETTCIGVISSFAFSPSSAQLKRASVPLQL
jgi:hypothetical protein